MEGGSPLSAYPTPKYIHRTVLKQGGGVEHRRVLITLNTHRYSNTIIATHTAIPPARVGSRESAKK